MLFVCVSFIVRVIIYLMNVCVFSSFAGVFTFACMLVCSFADMFGDWFPFVCLFL